MALWRSGALALWRSGALALWRSGALALWRSGALNYTGDCTHAVPSLPMSSLFPNRHPPQFSSRCARQWDSVRMHTMCPVVAFPLSALVSWSSYISLVSTIFIRTVLFSKSITDHRLSKARKSIPPSARAWTAGLVGLPRFSEHTFKLRIGGVCNGETSSAIHAGVPASDGRTGPVRPLRGGAGTRVRVLCSHDP